MKLSNREKFLLKMLFVVAVLCGGVLFLITPGIEKLSYTKQELAYKQQELASMQKMISFKDTYKQQLQEYETFAAFAQENLASITQPEQADALVSSLLEKHKFSIQNLKVSVTTLGGEIDCYTIDVKGNGAPQNSLLLLQEINETPYFTLTQLHCQNEKGNSMANYTLTIQVYSLNKEKYE